jgi:hypothetical protein
MMMLAAADLDYTRLGRMKETGRAHHPFPVPVLKCIAQIELFFYPSDEHMLAVLRAVAGHPFMFYGHHGWQG